MVRKVVVVFNIFLLVCLAGTVQAGVSLQAPPQLSSIAYAVYDGDYRYLILEKNAFQRRSIASMTKVMTLLVAIEYVEAETIKLTDTVTASARAASREGTQIKLRAGDEFTVEELLYATALVSANDAAVALAEHLAGTEADFTHLMNTRAQELGLVDTHYVDSTGLLSIFSNNYSTAFDQAVLLRVALDHDLFRQILQTQEYFLKSQDRTIKNSHPFLDTPGVEGGKTGATTPAGHTLITSCVRDGRRLIIVTLGARSREVRNEENGELLEWAFSSLHTLISTDEVLATVEVRDGVNHHVNATLAQNFSIVPVAETDLDYSTELDLATNIRAPVDRGDKVGELVVRKGDEEFVRLDLVAQQSTGLATWLRRVVNQMLQLLGR